MDNLCITTCITSDFFLLILTHIKNVYNLFFDMQACWLYRLFCDSIVVVCFLVGKMSRGNRANSQKGDGNLLFFQKWLTALRGLSIITLLWCKFYMLVSMWRRCLRWNRHISLTFCGKKEPMASVKEWRPKAAVWFWKDVAWKAERNFLHNFFKLNRKVPFRRDFSVLLQFQELQLRNVRCMS